MPTASSPAMPMAAMPAHSLATASRYRAGVPAACSGKFDLVACFHVLEHLRHPLAAVRKMAEWTAPDGLVYIEVPDLGATNPNKGFGAFHFAHLTGFNHHNLLLGAAIAGLRPKAAVSPTGVIFEHGAARDHAGLAESGRKLTESLYGQNRAVRNFFRYQLEKVWRKR